MPPEAQPDHDLLVRLDTKMDMILSTVCTHVPADCIAHAAQLGEGAKKMDQLEKAQAWACRMAITSLGGAVVALGIELLKLRK